MTRNNGRTGFSMAEILIVIAVVAILTMMAGPALIRLVPMQRLRGEAQSAAAFMRQARLRAANTQKPVRVSLACPTYAPATCPAKAGDREPCALRLDTANYEDGRLTGWTRAPGSGHELARPVFFVPPLKDAQGDGENNSPGVVWVIFMPSGRAFSFPKPFSLNLRACDLRGGEGPGWELAVNNDSGRASLERP